MAMPKFSQVLLQRITVAEGTVWVSIKIITRSLLVMTLFPVLPVASGWLLPLTSTRNPRRAARLLPGSCFLVGDSNFQSPLHFPDPNFKFAWSDCTYFRNFPPCLDFPFSFQITNIYENRTATFPFLLFSLPPTAHHLHHDHDHELHQRDY